MENLFVSVLSGDFNIKSYIICTAVAFLCGIIIAAVASYKTNISKSFLISLLVLPAIVETVIIMVNGNVGTGIAVAGAFSLVRFRSVPGKAREIVSIFAAMTAGLACAAGYVAIAVLFSAVVSAAILMAMKVPLKSEQEYELLITVPETLNYSEAFGEVFDKFTKDYRLISVKTTNMGSLYKLCYKTILKDKSTVKQFTDELRTRNGNLEIKLSIGDVGADEL